MSDYGLTTVPATGNEFQPTTRKYDTFLDVSGGNGNWSSEFREVHLKIRSNDGTMAQGWFDVADLKEAIAKAEAVPLEFEEGDA